MTEIVSPLSGTVKDVHKEVEDDTELLNSTDRAENWIVELTDVAGYDSEDLSDDPWFGEEKL